MTSSLESWLLTVLFHALLQASLPGDCLVLAKVTRCVQCAGILEVILRQPRVLGLNVETTLRPRVSMLTDMGFSRAGIAREVVQQPRLLACKPERYKGILRVMQEHEFTIKVSPRPSSCP